MITHHDDRWKRSLTFSLCYPHAKALFGLGSPMITPNLISTKHFNDLGVPYNIGGFQTVVDHLQVFLELERAGSHDLELLLKSSDASGSMSPNDVHTLRDILKLGDVVSASGFIESGTFTLAVTHIDVTEPWKAKHAGISFVPKLLPSLHGNTQSCSSAAGAMPPHEKLASVQLQHSTTQPLCKYWVNTGRCLHGDTCAYLHVKPSQLPELRQGWVTARRRHKQELSQEAGNPHGLDAARKGQRAAIFCDWLMATFGSEVMKEGSGVLDIAGGRGNVSFELQTVRGIRCTLIDPRPQKISKSQRKWLKSFASSQPNDIATMQHSDTSTPIASTDIPPTSPDLPAQAGLPQHVTRKLQHSTAAAPGSTDGALSAVTPPAELSCSATHHQDSAQAQVSAAEEPALPGSAAAQGSAIEAEVLADAAQAQASVSQTRAPCEGQQSCMAHSQQPASHDEGCKLQQSVSTQASAQQNWPDLRGTLSKQADFSCELWTEGELAKQLQSCSLILGLHPDQATDSIVEFAMQFGKPFAVVPCCVFPRQFQDRQLLNGHGKMQQVLTHSDLVEYLMQKSDGLHEYLMFEGMNQVVFGNVPTFSTS